MRFLSQLCLPKPFIKICGVTNICDVLICEELGVNAVGILTLQPGKEKKPDSDRLTLEEATALAKRVPTGLAVFLLIHSDNLGHILMLCQEINPSALQIQVPLNIDCLKQIKESFPQIAIIHTFKVKARADVNFLILQAKALHNEGVLDGLVIDSARGGSGQTHDWSVSAELVKEMPEIFTLLAGGLCAENVARALQQVRPTGVDVMSSVNAAGTRSRKDRIKLQEFVRNSRLSRAEQN